MRGERGGIPSSPFLVHMRRERRDHGERREEGVEERKERVWKRGKDRLIATEIFSVKRERECTSLSFFLVFFSFFIYYFLIFIDSLF